MPVHEMTQHLDIHRPPADEEKQARETLRRQEKMRKGLAASRARSEKERMWDAIQDTRTMNVKCRCELRKGMTREDVRGLGAGCTVFYVCPRLDSVRRRMGD